MNRIIIECDKKKNQIDISGLLLVVSWKGPNWNHRSLLYLFRCLWVFRWVSHCPSFVPDFATSKEMVWMVRCFSFYLSFFSFFFFLCFSNIVTFHNMLWKSRNSFIFFDLTLHNMKEAVDTTFAAASWIFLLWNCVLGSEFFIEFWEWTSQREEIVGLIELKTDIQCHFFPFLILKEQNSKCYRFSPFRVSVHPKVK